MTTLIVDADDGGPLDVEHVEAVAAGGTLEEINARLNRCKRPALATEPAEVEVHPLLAALVTGWQAEVRLHTVDPRVDAQTTNEVTYTGYSRQKTSWPTFSVVTTWPKGKGGPQ